MSGRSVTPVPRKREGRFPSRKGRRYPAPSAVSSYIMAKNMHSDDELAGQILIFTTLISSVTLFIGIFLLKSFHLI